MKNINNYDADKYGVLKQSKYKKIEDGIYELIDNDEILYVTSLSFVQEPEYDEGENAEIISQYPLEDILDKFYCHISDFYEDLNKENSQICYQEFAAMSLENIQNLRNIMGKHVYNKEEIGQDGKNYVRLMIE